MPVSREKRAKIAEQILGLGPPELAQHPRFRALLDEYVATGTLGDLADNRFVHLVNLLETQSGDDMNRSHAQRLITGGVSSLFQILVRDERGRKFVKDTLASPDLPLGGDAAAVRQFAQDRVTSFMASRATGNPQMDAALEAYTAALRQNNVADEDFMRRYLDAYVRRQFPDLTEAETRRAVNEFALVLKAQAWDNPSGVPEGCMIPMAFVAAFMFLTGVMGLLLLLFIGEEVLHADFWQSDVGRSLSATTFLMALISGLFAWFRRRGGIGGGMIRFTLMLAFIIAAGLVGVQLLLVKPDTVSAALTGDTDRLLTVALFTLSILTSIVLWVRWRVMNMLWLLFIFVVLAAVLALMVTEMGVVDLREIDIENAIRSIVEAVGG